MWPFGKNRSEMTLEQVSEVLRKLRLPIALTITPINLEEEKTKFLASNDYNPQFKYKIRSNNNEAVFKELKNLKKISDVDPRISEFYINLIQNKKTISSLLNVIGDNKNVSMIAKSYYGMPTLKQFNNACLVLKRKVKKYNIIPDQETTRILKYDEVKKAIDLTLNELGLSDWKAKESLNIAKNGIKVGHKGKEILVDRNIEKSVLLVKKSIIHEIGTHVLRSHNGTFSGVPALYNANIQSYLDAEEGLALYNEEYMGVLTYEFLKHRALLLYAIYVGENMSFRELFNVLRGFCKPIEAFDIVYRVKRGLSDTSLPGIYTKDAAYFRGFRKVKRTIEKDPSVYAKLYAGKIGLKMIGWVDDGLIEKPKIVPSKEIFDNIFRKIGL